MTGPLTTLAVHVKGPSFLTFLDPVVPAAREDFRYMPTFVLTEVSQLRCIAVCHRAQGLVV